METVSQSVSSNSVSRIPRTTVWGNGEFNLFRTEPFDRSTGHSIRIRDCPEKFGTVGNPTGESGMMT